MKFGGTSVGDVAAFERVFHIVSTQIERHPVVVVSAMTKVTDALLAAFETAKKGDLAEAFASLEPHFERHIEVVQTLHSRTDHQTSSTPNSSLHASELSDLLMRAARAIAAAADAEGRDRLYGEQLSSRLLAEVLKAKGVNARQVDSRRLIVTDDEYGAAQPIMDETNETRTARARAVDRRRRSSGDGRLYRRKPGGETTTLGRGGSDYSAALVAAALDAGELQIWTDVTGVMTCDPRICGEARTIPVLSYEEAAELAYFGAKVLHPKTIKPAVDHAIPVRVCNTFEPDEIGTMVLAESGEAPNKIKSIAHKKNITILRITSARMLGSYGFMSAVFQVFERYRTVIDVISTSEVSIALTLDNTAEIDKIVDDLRRLGDVEVEPGYAVICVVGEGLRASTGLASKIFSTIDDVNIALVSHGASA